MCSGFWSGTNRQEMAARATAGMTVRGLPPLRRLMSSVGRVQRLSRRGYSCSPTSEGHTQGAAIGLFVHREGGVETFFAGRKRLYSLVEIGHSDVSFGVDEARQGVDEQLVGVVDNAAEKAGVHVLRRSKNLDLGIDNAAQTQRSVRAGPARTCWYRKSPYRAPEQIRRARPRPQTGSTQRCRIPPRLRSGRPD